MERSIHFISETAQELKRKLSGNLGWSYKHLSASNNADFRFNELENLFRLVYRVEKKRKFGEISGRMQFEHFLKFLNQNIKLNELFLVGKIILSTSFFEKDAEPFNNFLSFLKDIPSSLDIHKVTIFPTVYNSIS